LEPDPEALRPNSDDLEILANLVREAGRTPAPPEPLVETGRRGHLRMLRGEADPAGRR
jgi:hypothetical protein